MSVEQLRLVDWLDEQGAAVGIPESGELSAARLAWPTGPRADVMARRALVEWAFIRNLRYAPGQHLCPGWLRNGRCQGPSCPGTTTMGWRDHGTAWTRDGRPALLLGQPYALTSADARGLRALDNAFEVEITTAPWYPRASANVCCLGVYVWAVAW